MPRASVPPDTDSVNQLCNWRLINRSQQPATGYLAVVWQVIDPRFRFWPVVTSNHYDNPTELDRWAVIDKRLIHLPLVLLISACSSQPIETTPPIEPGTPVAAPAESQTPSVDRRTLTLPPSATATEVPPETPIPTSTPIPIQSTPPPTAQRGRIVALDVTPAQANPGDTVTLRWAAQGDRATVCPSSRYSLFTAADCVNVPLSGTLAFIIPADVKGNTAIDFLLTVTGVSAATQQTSVALNCQKTWFFSTERQAGVCPQEVIRTEAAFQPFERGQLIWLKTPGRYFILENQNVAPGDIRRPLSTIADPLTVSRQTADTVKPPANLYAPTSGFGLIWRGDVEASSGFRAQLGWALQPEVGYEASYQCDDAAPSGGRVWQTCYLTVPSGQIIAALSTGAWYWREEQLHQGLAKILTFSAKPTEARLGDTLTLAWTSIGGATATLLEPICCTYTPSPLTTQPLNGSLSFVLQAGVERDTFAYILTVNSDTTSDSQTVRVHLPCPDRYFFTTTRDDLECPAAAPTTSAAVEQRFEQGRMIWLQAQRKIYVLFGSGQAVAPGAPPDSWLIFDDTWQTAEPESDPAIVPPSGLYQPVRGFGKVWRVWPDVRNGLGWAMAPEQAFDGVYQRGWQTCLLHNSDGSVRSCSGPSNDVQYLRAVDGRIMRLRSFGVLGRHGVQQWELWTP